MRASWSKTSQYRLFRDERWSYNFCICYVYSEIDEQLVQLSFSIGVPLLKALTDLHSRVVMIWYFESLEKSCPYVNIFSSVSLNIKL